MVIGLAALLEILVYVSVRQIVTVIEFIVSCKSLPNRVRHQQQQKK
jgi:hypothetical protein